MSTEGILVRPATEGDLPAIQRIYNHAILNTVATWDLEPWPDERRLAWFEEHSGDRSQPVLVAELEGEIAGFAYLSEYRPKVGYRHTREDTVYIDERFHRRGVGRALLHALIEDARHLEVHVLLAVIEASNEASIALHREAGFVVAGHMHQTGRKFGRWLDSMIMELHLPFEP